MEAESCTSVTHTSSYGVLIKKNKEAGVEAITVELMIQQFCSVTSRLLVNIYPKS